MLFETLLSLHLMHSQPVIPFAATTTIRSSRSFSSSSSIPSGKSYSSSSSTYRPSPPVRIQSSYRPPSTIRVSRTPSSPQRVSVPKTTSAAPKPSPALVPKVPTVSRSSAGNVVISKQKTPQPITKTTPTYNPSPSVTRTSSPVISHSPSPVIRETYIERSSDNFLTNPFFWMYLNESNRNDIPPPAPVVVQAQPSVATMQQTETTQSNQNVTTSSTQTKNEKNIALESTINFLIGFGIGLLLVELVKRFI